jgi:hypothetical protein
MADSRARLYTRYSFSAAAEIVDGSGARLRTRVTNISYGGCRLLTQGQLRFGTAVTVKIYTPTDNFEAPAKVAHATANDA